jgi:hypothetical protein
LRACAGLFVWLRHRQRLVRIHAVSKSAFLDHFVHPMNKVRTRFWHTVLSGYGQNAI